MSGAGGTGLLISSIYIALLGVLHLHQDASEFSSESQS